MPDRYYLLGSNVGRSPTPRMMSAAFREMGIEVDFQVLDVPAREFATVFRGLRERGFQGANITMPHKHSVIGLLDSVDGAASKVQAVNTVKRENGSYEGYNTDILGVIQPLKARGVKRPAAAAVLGTGGAARAFVAAMVELGCRKVVAISRDPAAAAPFFSEIGGAFPSVKVEPASVDAIPRGPFEIFFNATPCGSNGIPLPRRLAGAMEGRPIVFDAVYAPIETPLISLAKESGCPVIYGHEMLLHQGGEAFRLWTGDQPPLRAMRRALMENLEVPA